MKTLHFQWLTLSFILILMVGCDADKTSTNKLKAPSVDTKKTIDVDASQKQSKLYTTEDFFKTTTLFGSSINHNKTAVLVSSDETGVFNAYRYPIDGSETTQLTQSTTDTIYGMSWFPTDDRILYTSDQGGNELNHVYVRELDGKIKDLTPGEKLKAQFIRWTKDQQFFFISTNERDPKSFDLYRYSIKNYERELVYQNDKSWSLGSVSPNGEWLSLAHTVSNSDSNLYLVNLIKKDTKPFLITIHDGDVSYRSYTFTPNSKQLIYATNEHGEYNQAWIYNIENGNKTVYHQANWDVSFVYFSKSGKYQVIGVNQNAQTKIALTEVANGNAIQLPDLPKGDLRGINFSADDQLIVFYINSDTSPSNLFSYRFGDKQIKKHTQSLNPEIQESDLVSSEVKRFKSFDGLEIPGLLYQPKQANANNKVPALILVHGGPGGQSRKGYRAMVQHLVNNGYAIFSVNNRGSSGYGKTFFHLDDKKHGEDDLQDIVYGKKYLQTLDWIDADRIGIMGGSYGGYMTMAGMAFTDEFKVGINIFGVTNWTRTLTSIPPWWESFKKSLYDEMGDPATDADRHHAISPLFHADKIKNPVLIVQGANDPRVLQVESDEMVDAIRKNKVAVEYVLFPDEGHGFRKKANRITASNAYIEFLNKHL